MTADDGPVGRREVAYRLFAIEYDDADLEYSDSEEERAPNYVVTPTGARVNRLFVVGVLTEVEPVSEEVLRARVVDPTGAFVAYAGQYQPVAAAFLEDADVPSFVSLTGKARTFRPDGSDRVFTSVRPESITAVDAETRDRWTVQAAEHTLARIATMARALEREERGGELEAVLRSAGVAPGLASGVALAIDHYDTTSAYLSALRTQAIAATEVVTGDREAVPDFELSPDATGPVDDGLAAAPAVSGTFAGVAEFPASAADGAPRPEPEPEATPVADPRGAVDAETADAEPDSAGALDRSDAEFGEASTPERGPDDGADELGDFEEPGAPTDEAEPASEQYDLDDDEREAVEAEFGTEFSTGSEVGEPGEAGIEPETEPPGTDDEEAVPSDVEPVADPDAGPAASAETEAAAADEASVEVGLEDAVVEAMADLDDGDGADRGAVVAAVVDAHGVNAEAVESAIQDALMGGRCYEPSDGTLKAI